MTEKMDPEDVKILMEDIFEQSGKIVEKYEGTVDSFFGDEILVLFGIPKVHEDDPVRAVHAAIEIHDFVEEFSKEFEKTHNTNLSMHTGIDTGLVITGDKFIGKGRQGLAGDTINLASRLTKLAKPGEIIIGADTYKNAKNHFSFESCDPVAIKGKKDPVQTFKLIDTQTRMKRTRQLHGVRADLIGRDRELMEFGDAVKALKSGKGSIYCLYGFAGSGKSRLVEEFKATTSVQWFEGYTYPYTKNTPYFPIMTLFNHAMDLSEEDSQKTLKSKIEKSLGSLIKDSKDVIPYIGVLYSLNYPEIESVSPEFFKTKLFDAILRVISAISQTQPTIICIEDLHWADRSSLELIRFIHSKIEAPVLFLYITRPIIEIFSESQIDQINQTKLKYHEIRIEDLSTSDSKTMVQSLLNTKQIPKKLETFIEKKTQGNPFYLEEIINSLIESNVLKKDNKGRWQLLRKITESDISSSIHGVISARVDRLETDSRRILQEASVIGRSFYYEIINKISETKKDINTCLETLEGLDLIKTAASNRADKDQTKIDLEYIFKHALTQEVVYNGLLKAQRKVIHEKIGTVIEQIFHDRLPEFYETLAHHFLKGSSTLKAVDYLIKSGDKSLKRYSLDESHDYFQQAFDLLDTLPEKTAQTDEIMIDLLTRWAMVFYYYGTFYNFGKLLSSQEHLINNMEDNEIKGMFIGWQGYGLEFIGEYVKAEALLQKALDIGISINNKKVIGYACTWLAWVCGDLGNFKKGIEYGTKANEIAKKNSQDHYLYFKSLGGIGWNYFWMGFASEGIKIGEKIILSGSKYSQTRSEALGYDVKCGGYIQFGNFNKSVVTGKQAIAVSVDPLYKYYFSTRLAHSFLLSKNIKKADDLIQKAMQFYKKNNDKLIGDIAILQGSVVDIENGRMSQGLKHLRNIEQTFIKQQRKNMVIYTRLILGKVYLEIIQKTKPISILTMIKNIGFIIQNVPTAYKKAIYWYSKSIEMAEETGAIGIKAQALLDLGIIYRIKRQNDKAKESLETAIEIFEEVGAYAFLKQAKQELKLCSNPG
jgi:class 3 adenylate cyclase/tetratricopeptide (TPR) repeat protein